MIAEAQPACVGYDPELWFSEQPAAIAAARQVCLSCPVIGHCLEGALKRREAYGIWASTTPRKRKQLLASAAAA